MNRREAIAALVALPEVTRISIAPLKANDVIVVEGARAMSEESMARIKGVLEQVWPGHRCIVLSEGLSLKVVAS